MSPVPRHSKPLRSLCIVGQHIGASSPFMATIAHACRVSACLPFCARHQQRVTPVPHPSHHHANADALVANDLKRSMDQGPLLTTQDSAVTSPPLQVVYPALDVKVKNVTLAYTVEHEDEERLFDQLSALIGDALVQQGKQRGMTLRALVCKVRPPGQDGQVYVPAWSCYLSPSAMLPFSKASNRALPCRLWSAVRACMGKYDRAEMMSVPAAFSC